MAEKSITHKYCPTCKVAKPKTDFYKNRAQPDGIDCHCKVCNGAHRARWSKTESGKAKLKARGQRYRQSDAGKEYQRKYSREWKRRLPPERKKAINRRNNLSRAYGMSIDEYDAMLSSQEGICAICSEPPKEGKFLVVDHDHTSGTVRGLLCSPCNTALGSFREDLKIFESAIAYLSTHRLKSLRLTA